MSVFSEESLQRVKDAIDIVDLIGGYVDLKKSGQSYKACCPFHQEKTPSFIVTPSRGRYKCFGCGEGGDGIQFIMKMEGLDFTGAVRFLADKYHITLEEQDAREEAWEARKNTLYAINREACLFFYKNLLTQMAPQNYLRERGFDSSIINPFYLGYADASGSSLYLYLHDKGYRDEDLLHLGLVAKSNSGRGYYDKFRNRLIFPIFSSRSRIIGFGGRILGPGQPKYLNSPESDIFHKGSNLYALDRQKRSQNRKKIILVEGYMDVAALAAHGIDYAVASLGTSLTEDQAKLIKKSAEEIYISYDGDGAGIKASRRAVDIFHQVGVNPKLVLLPDGLDPDDYIKKKGVEAYQAELDQAVEPVEFEFQLLKAGFNLEDPEEKIAFIRQSARFLATIEEMSIRDLYTGRVADLAQISKESLGEDVSRVQAEVDAEKEQERERRERQEAYRKRVEREEAGGSEAAWAPEGDGNNYASYAPSSAPSFDRHRPYRRGRRDWREEKRRQAVAETRLWTGPPPPEGSQVQDREREGLEQELVRLVMASGEASDILAGAKDWLGPESACARLVRCADDLREQGIPVACEWVRKTGLDAEEESLVQQIEEDQRLFPIEEDQAGAMARELLGRIDHYRLRQEAKELRDRLQAAWKREPGGEQSQELMKRLKEIETALREQGGSYDGEKVGKNG